MITHKHTYLHAYIHTYIHTRASCDVQFGVHNLAEEARQDLFASDQDIRLDDVVTTVTSVGRHM
jgi:hypothetical protein